MKNLFISEILNYIIVIGIGVLSLFVRRQLKIYTNSKLKLIEIQKEAIKQSMGIAAYNKDRSLVIDIVKTVEQLGKEFNWNDEFKHIKVLQFIEGKTGLSDEEIYNMIKSTVLDINRN
ncbi:hypothetical protein SAMN02745134_02964 [Clostridium acidisoli DSM 12555]|uniref:Bacteriophage holin of superfamily 6 (Holin_LLH) n=1 Tax=Clostridium acidisoli DSM 12555 TaxID=1121291 RepID=A0A1W1XSK7_9CLOT|nr:hypothetical protein [Clostridium acidisoli]SMC26832.1 hypothetical protein SAMN02745134_02964 [Clostridium acidisoli DSM 12555]